jgi:plastocyanin
MTKRARFTAVAAIGLALLTACGGGGGEGGDGPVSTVTMRDNEFVPADPTIAAGQIELVNEGESPHTFTVGGQDVDVEVEAGGSTTATVDLDPGTYTLFCSFHRTQGMEGTLTVQ